MMKAQASGRARTLCGFRGRLRTADRGFTLLELMITLLITSIVLVSLGAILKTTVEVKIAVISEIRVRKLGPTILAMISRDLQNAWATGPVEDVEIDGSFLVGKHNGDDDTASDKIDFVTSINSFMRYENISSDLTEVGYYVKENDVPDDDPRAGLSTLYRREDFSVDKRPDEGGIGVKLYDRIVSFRIWYYDIPRGALDEEGRIDPSELEDLVTRGSSEEKDDWDTDDEERLPYAVRVEIVIDATPTDAFTAKRKRRYAVYETLVRMPNFPKLDDKVKLFSVKSPNFPKPPEESENDSSSGD